MEALPVLFVEMAVPEGREDEWNEWYHGSHIPLVLNNVPGVVSCRRYRLYGGEDTFKYFLAYEFDSVESLKAHHDRADPNNLGGYDDLWGWPSAFRRRWYEPVWYAEPDATAAAGLVLEDGGDD